MTTEKPGDTLKSDANFLRPLLDSIADPIFVKDEHHRWVYGNPAFWRILGEDAEARFLMKDDSSVFPREEVEVFWKVDDRILASGEAIENEETLSVGDKKIIVRTMKSPFRLPNGRPGLVGVIRDITREKNAENEASSYRREAARKSEFLATMSHELRTPLNAILGMVQVAKFHDLNDQHAGIFDTIEDAGEHLLELITNVLDITRNDVDRLELHEDWFDLSALLASIEPALSMRARDKGLDLVFETKTDTACSYFGDMGRVRQILLNLLGNSVKFTARGTVRLTVEHARDGDGLTFSVADTGRGIDAENLARIFEPFHRAPQRAGEVIDGAGLGLSIVDRLVRQMEGKIDVTSIFGKGTTITVTLPLQNKVSDEAGANSGNADELALLCAEDDEINRKVLEALLAPITRNIAFVTDGQSACDAARENCFDAILMDVRLPVMSGVEATRQIREDENALGRAPVPIIAVTANALGQQVQECLDAGMNYHLAKPINSAQLIRAVVNAVDANPASAFRLQTDIAPERPQRPASTG